MCYVNFCLPFNRFLDNARFFLDLGERGLRDVRLDVHFLFSRNGVAQLPYGFNCCAAVQVGYDPDRLSASELAHQRRFRVLHRCRIDFCQHRKIDTGFDFILPSVYAQTVYRNLRFRVFRNAVQRFRKLIDIRTGAGSAVPDAGHRSLDIRPLRRQLIEPGNDFFQTAAEIAAVLTQLVKQLRQLGQAAGGDKNHGFAQTDKGLQKIPDHLRAAGDDVEDAFQAHAVFVKRHHGSHEIQSRFLDHFPQRHNGADHLLRLFVGFRHAQNEILDGVEKRPESFYHSLGDANQAGDPVNDLLDKVVQVLNACQIQVAEIIPDGAGQTAKGLNKFAEIEALQGVRQRLGDAREPGGQFLPGFLQQLEEGIERAAFNAVIDARQDLRKRTGNARRDGLQLGADVDQQNLGAVDQHLPLIRKRVHHFFIGGGRRTG